MQGRLENKIRVETNIKKILSEMPEFMSDYYYSLSSNEPKSCMEQLRKIRRFLYFVNNNIFEIDIGSISDVDISKYMKSLETKNSKGMIRETSFAYRKQNYSFLKTFFKYLTKKGYIKTNPMDLVEVPKDKDHVTRVFLTEDELKTCMLSIKEGAGTTRAINRQKEWMERDRAIFALFICTGMRETALSEINIGDIDFAHNKIFIIDKGHKVNEYVIKENLKSALVDWIDKRDELLADKQCDALFISNRRTRITSNSVANIVRKYTKEALGKEISPHKLRAAFCNILLKKTGDIHFVSKAVGHANVSTTQIYLDDDMAANKERASEYMESIF